MPNQIQVIIGQLEEATEKVVTRLSVNITAELIEATPVDLGWARANWIPAIGTPFIEDATPTSREGRQAAVPSQRARQQAAVASLATSSYSLSRGPVFLSNNVPYITRLNDGSSDQAPTGFVQAAIQRGIMSLGDRIPA